MAGNNQGVSGPGYYLDPRNMSSLDELMQPQQQPMIADAAGRRSDVLQTLLGLIPQPVRDFASGGIHGVLKGQGVQTPQWMDQTAAVLQNPDFNAAIGVATPFKSPWGFANYTNVTPAQHISNLKTAIGQHARDLTEFNKLYPGEAHAGRAKLQQLRQELRDVQTNFGGE